MLISRDKRVFNPNVDTALALFHFFRLITLAVWELFSTKIASYLCKTNQYQHTKHNLFYAKLNQTINPNF